MQGEGDNVLGVLQHEALPVLPRAVHNTDPRRKVDHATIHRVQHVVADIRAPIPVNPLQL